MPDHPFELTTISTHQIGDKLGDIQAMEEVLNGSLSLSSYGDALEEVFIMFNVLGPESPSSNDEFIYHPEDKLLEVVLKMRHNLVMEASRAEVRQLMEASLRQALVTALPELEIPDFRAGEFASDVLNALEIPV